MFKKRQEMKNDTPRATASRAWNFFSVLLISLLFIAGIAGQPQLSIAATVNNNGNGYYGNGFNGNGFNGQGIPIILKSIAILPLENLTGNPQATDIVTEYIKRELKGKGWVLITKADTVEEFLAKRRIRYTGAITRMTVREMGKVLGIDAVLVGSVTQFSSSNGNVTVGVSARLVSTLDGSLIWADNQAYTTRDFVGLLGLGAVTSLDEISSLVVKNLVKSIADKFFINGAALSPFEIERVAAYPAVGKGGVEVELKVKVLPLIEEPKEVKAVVEGTEVDLSRVGNGEYEGSVIAPRGEGVYFVDIVATDQTGVPFPFDAAGKIVVDNTPPKVNMTLDKKIFASGRRSSIIFTPRLLSLDEIDEWRMEILNREGKLVRRDRGYGKLPKKLIWRGVTAKHSRVEDGEYTCKFSVRDVAGNEAVITDMVRVKNNPPDIKVDVDVIDDILLFTFNYDPDENIQSWELSMVDRKGETLKKIVGEGDVPEKFEYPLDEDFDFRKMSFSITALDDAGNSFNLTKALPSFFTGKRPFARLKGKGQFLDDF
jgi:TolB-like protein